MTTWPRKLYESFSGLADDGADANVRAKRLHFKFSAVTTGNAYADVTLTQVDDEGTEIAASDPYYALTGTGTIINRAGLVNVCADFEETGATNGATFKIQVRNVGGTFGDLANSETAVSTDTVSTGAFDGVDGHAQLKVQVKSTTTDSAATAAGYLHIS